VTQETKDMYKSAQAARNRRLGLIMLSVAFVFFMGIVMKRVMFG
jgi:t-SNARE complex subunit (syntaxin)